MKKRIVFSICIVLTALSGLAQPIVNSNIFPSVGTVYYSYSTSLPSGPGQSGANRTWNFSGLSFDPNEVDSSTVFSVSMTQVRDSFLNGQIAIGDFTDTTYRVFSNNQQRCEMHGNTNRSEITRFSTPLNYLVYPLSFNNTFLSSTRVTGPQGVINANVTTTYDGYGTILLPDGQTHSNVLRVKTIQVGTGGSGGTTADTETVTYEWYLPTQFQSVFKLEINRIEIFGNIIYDTSAVMSRVTLISAVEEPKVVESVVLYPNPVKDGQIQLEIETNDVLSDVYLEVWDMSGRLVKSNRIEELVSGSNTIRIGVDELTSGAYGICLKKGERVLLAKSFVKSQ